MSSEMFSHLPSIGGWGIIGFATGFVAKKLMKYLLIVMGIYCASLIYLQQQGFVEINRDLGRSADEIVALLFQQVESYWSTAVVSLSVFGAFGAGAYLGFRKG